MERLENSMHIKGITDSVLLCASIAPKLPGLCYQEQQGNYLMMDEWKKRCFWDVSDWVSDYDK